MKETPRFEPNSSKTQHAPEYVRAIHAIAFHVNLKASYRSIWQYSYDIVEPNVLETSLSFSAITSRSYSVLCAVRAARNLLVDQWIKHKLQSPNCL